MTVIDRRSARGKPEPTEQTPRGKTKVLLALGAHGKVDGPNHSRVARNTDFFRRVAVPFLEEHVGGKDSVVVIFENTMGFDDSPTASTITPEQISLRELRAGMDEKNRAFADMMARTINAGGSTDAFFDWGFNDVIMQLNSDQTQVLCIAEPILAETVLKQLEYSNMREKIRLLSALHNGSFELFMLQLEQERLNLESCLLRDSAVVEMAGRLRENSPAIIIVRGLAHKPMRVLFDDNYDVAVEVDGNYHPDFAIEAMERFYQGELDDADLGTMMMRELTFNSILRAEGIDIRNAADREDTEFFRRAAEKAVRLTPVLPKLEV